LEPSTARRRASMIRDRSIGYTATETRKKESTMRTRLLSICAALALCACGTAAARAESIDDVFKKMRDKFKGYKTIQYKTTMTNDMSMGGMSVKSTTEMTLQAAHADGKPRSRAETKTKMSQKMGDQPEAKTDTDSLMI